MVYKTLACVNIGDAARLSGLGINFTRCQIVSVSGTIGVNITAYPTTFQGQFWDGLILNAQSAGQSIDISTASSFVALSTNASITVCIYAEEQQSNVLVFNHDHDKEEVYA